MRVVELEDRGKEAKTAKEDVVRDREMWLQERLRQRNKETCCTRAQESQKRNCKNQRERLESAVGNFQKDGDKDMQKWTRESEKEAIAVAGNKKGAEGGEYND